MLGLAVVVQAQAQQEADEPEPTAAAGPGEPPEFAAWTGRTQSDNLARAVDGTRGTYDSLGVVLAAGHESVRISGRIDSELELRSYSDDSVDSETVGTLNAFTDFTLARDVLFWGFKEVYDQGRIDPFAALGPGNRDAINVFSGGPRLEIPLGSRTNLSVVGDYALRRYKDTESLDSDLERYDITLFREARPTMGFGLVASTNETEYTDPAVAPYTIDRISLLYASEFSTGGVRVQWGTNEITSQGRSSQEPLFLFDWSRGISARSTLRFSAARQFGDTGSLTSPYEAGVPQASEAGTSSDLLLSSDPFEEKRFGFGYQFVTTRTSIDVDLEATDDRYPGSSTFDNEALRTRLSLNRTVSERLHFGFDFERVRRDFTDATVTSETNGDSSFGAWVDRALSRRFSVAVVLARYKREASESLKEDRVQLRFANSPTGSSPSALRYAAR